MSHCAPGRFGTVDQYRAAFDLDDTDDRSDPDEYDSYYSTDDTGGVLDVSEKPQDHTRIPTEGPVASDSRHDSEFQTPREHSDDAFTTTNEPTTDVQTTQATQW